MSELDAFVKMVRELRELGAVKVRHGELEAVFATVHRIEPAPAAVTTQLDEPAPITTPPPRPRSKPTKPDYITEEQERLARLREELES